MSKVRSAAQGASSNQQSVSNLSNLSVDAVSAFNDVFSSAEIDDAALNQQKNDQNSSSPQEFTMKEKDEVKSSSSDESVDLTTKTKEVELSDEEKKEIEEMESQEVSVLELAKQLNVAMNTLLPNANHPQGQNPEMRDVRIVFTDEKKHITKTISAENISHELLRKIDVETLNNQLDKVLSVSQLAHLEPPIESIAENADTVVAQFIVPTQVMTHLNFKKQNVQESEDENLLNELEGLEIEDVDVDVNLNLNVKTDLNSDFKADEALQISNTDPKPLDLSSVGLSNRADTADQSLNSFPEMDLNFDGSHLNTVSAPVSSSPHFKASPYKANAHPFEMRVQQAVESTMKDMLIKKENGITKIQMSPESLGRIEISLEIDEKGVRADIVTENAEAKEIVLRHLPVIRALVQSENLNLEHFSARQDASQFFESNSNSRQNNEDSASTLGFEDDSEGLVTGVKNALQAESSLQSGTHSIVSVRI